MPELHLRVNVFGDEPIGDTPLLARVERLDRRERKSSGRTMVVVPAGDDYQKFATLDLPEGRYAVEVALPSGRPLLAECELRSDSKLEIAVPSSPHEWLAWQHLAGNVGDRVESRPSWLLDALAAGQSTTQIAALSRGAEGDADLLGSLMRLESTPAAELWAVHYPRASVAWLELERAIRRDLDPPTARYALGAAARPLALPPRSDGRAQVFRLTSQHFSPAIAAAEQHAFVFVQNGPSARIVSAPVPWYRVDGRGEAEFELMTLSVGDGVTAVVRDAGLASVLGYLASGYSVFARPLVERAEEMLFHKIRNPFAAAAGAYVMVSTSAQNPETRWHPWIANLRSWFGWMPDGAIAHGWLLLKHQRSDSDVHAAFEAFFEACERGIPYYACGVRWLLDGLTLFVEDPEFAHRRADIERRLSAVRRIAGRTNFQQAFTSIRLTRR
jgi:hypothetical protein